MSRLPAFLMILCSLLLAAPAHAGTPDATARQEISALMDALPASGCRFQRNGQWYGATEARAHLQRKYDYLLKKRLVDSAEQFIDRAASQSSLSGRAYQVQCPGQSPMPAADWFGGQLKALRRPAGSVRLSPAYPSTQYGSLP